MYLMNAGQLLNRAGQTDEAIEVLQTSLLEREAAYGPEHAGTAYGQQALAEVYMSAGRFAEGLELSERALTTFLHAVITSFQPHLPRRRRSLRPWALRDDEVWQYVPGNASSVAKPMIDAALILAESMPDATGMRLSEATGGLGLRVTAAGFTAVDECDCVVVQHRHRQG